MQTYPLNIAAVVGDTQVFAAPGALYLRYVVGAAGGADAAILVRTKEGQAYLAPGDDLTRKDPPNDWRITANTPGTGISGKLTIGDGKSVAASVAGVVQVVDGGKARTLSGASYWGFGGVAGVGGQYAGVELYNPAGSGKNLLVAQVELASGIAQYFYLWNAAAQMAGAAGTVGNKKLGGPASVGVTRTTNAAAASGAASFGQFAIQAMSTCTLKFSDPLVIPPGYSVRVWSAALAADMVANFEYAEEAI